MSAPSLKFWGLGLKYCAQWKKSLTYLGISHEHSWVVYIESKENFAFESTAYHSSFLSEFCILCQISESLDKYLRNIFHSNEPCWDWLNFAVFDSTDPFFWSLFCLLTKSVIPQFPVAEFVNWYFKWTSRPGVAKKLLPVFMFGFAGFLTFCNDNYHCQRSNQESVDRLHYDGSRVLFVHIVSLIK